jgi:hypothetical protein
MLEASPADEWHPRTLRSTPYEPIRVVDQYFAVGRNGHILKSSDGLHWSEQIISALDEFYGIAEGNGMFVAVGKRGAVWNSTDGANWHRQDSGTMNDFTSVTFGTNRFVALTSGLSNGEILTSVDGASWELVLTQSAPFSAASYFKNRFVAISRTGVLTSLDARRWTNNYATFPASFGHLAQSPDLIVAAEASGFVVSTNGSSWTRTYSFGSDPSMGTGMGVNDLAYANGLFLAIATRFSLVRAYPGGPVNYFYEPAILTSPDGAVWTTSATPPGSNRLLKSAYSTGTRFVVVDTAKLRWSSPNGTNWSSAASDNGEDFSAVAYGNGNYVAVGSSWPADRAAYLTPLIATSPDGWHWSRRSIDFLEVGNVSDIVFGNGQFVALGPRHYQPQITPSGPFPATLLISSNGINWTANTLSTNRDVLNITYGKGQYLAMDRDPDGKSYRLLTSPDALEWTQLGPTHTNLALWAKAVYLNDTYFILGRQATPEAGLIMSSRDGLQWTRQTTDSFDLIADLAYGNGRYVAVGSVVGGFSYGNLAFSLASTNGTGWRRVSASFNSGGLGHVAFRNGSFIATGSLPFLAAPAPAPSPLWTSVDGESWKGQPLTDAELGGITSNGSTLVTVGRNGAIWQSGEFQQPGAPSFQFAGIDVIGPRTLRVSILSSDESEVALEFSSDLKSWTERKRFHLRNGTTETTISLDDARAFLRIRQ